MSALRTIVAVTGVVLASACGSEQRNGFLNGDPDGGSPGSATGVDRGDGGGPALGTAPVGEAGSSTATCAGAEGQPSNIGCEFWPVDLDNEYSQFNDAAGAPWGVVLSNPGVLTARVTIEMNEAEPGQPLKLTTVKSLTILPGSLAQLILPTREVDGSLLGKDEGSGTCLSSRAFRVRSTSPLVAYQFNPMKQMFSNDASLLLPTNGLGTKHRVLGWMTSNPILGGLVIPGLPDHSFVTVVGTEPGTKVTVTLGGAIVGGSGIAPTPKGGVVTATLGPFDVLNLESDGAPGDLSGTIVDSTAPVAVYTGGERGSAPYKMTPPLPGPPGWDGSDICCTDHLEEQVFPVESMGKTFIVTRSPIRSKNHVEPDVLRFMGVASPAVVKTSMPPPFDHFTLQPGEIHDTWTQTDVIVESTEPIAVGQILVSQHFTNATDEGGDPSLTIYPPIEQYRQDYLFLVPSSWVRNYVVIAAQVGATVEIDGATPTGCVISGAGPLGGVPYEARRCVITEGAHRMTGNKPFGIVSYGYGPVGSYAFTGGADVKKIYVPPPLK